MKRLLICLIAALALLAVGFAKDKDHDRDDKTARITNGPVIESVSNHSAMIAWSTNRPAGNVIMWGTDSNNLNQRVEKAWGGTNHRLEIKGLKPDTAYYFRVESPASQGGSGKLESSVEHFMTVSKGKNDHNYNVGVKHR
jgi:hypothetical protein